MSAGWLPVGMYQDRVALRGQRGELSAAVLGDALCEW